MTPLLAAALGLQEFFLSRGWRFCIIGGIAVLRWGEPRYTRDVDVTLLTGYGREDEFIEPLLAAGYSGRVPDAADFARRNRVLLLNSPSGIAIDIALGSLPFEALSIDRATLFEFEQGCSLLTCSAEDLIIHKLFAYRGRDLADVESIVERQMQLNWRYIEEQLTPLAEVKEEPAILATLRNLERGQR